MLLCSLLTTLTNLVLFLLINNQNQYIMYHVSLCILQNQRKFELYTVVQLITCILQQSVSFQVVRSVSKWSAGVDETEASIFSAYVDLIRQAKHFIYIENQFFITRSNVDEQKEVMNYIGYEIVQRIVEAHRCVHSLYQLKLVQ